MKVKQIIADAAKLLLKGDLANKLETNSVLTVDEETEVKYFLQGYNIIQHEIASEHLSLTAEERKEGDEIAFSSLLHTPIKIISVKDDEENKVSFSAYPDKIKLFDGGFHTVRYRYLPADKAVTDNFDYEKTKIGKRAFVLGTAAEYCLMFGRYEEAANWRAKFEKAADSPLTCGAKKIKGRIWG